MLFFLSAFFVSHQLFFARVRVGLCLTLTLHLHFFFHCFVFCQPASLTSWGFALLAKNKAVRGKMWWKMLMVQNKTVPFFISIFLLFFVFFSLKKKTKKKKTKKAIHQGYAQSALQMGPLFFFHKKKNNTKKEFARQTADYMLIPWDRITQ